jgi:hypothetical protein
MAEGLQMLVTVAEPLSVMVVATDCVPRSALRETIVFCDTERTSETLKLMEDAPAGIVIELGIEIAVLLEESEIKAPPVPAALERATEHVVLMLAKSVVAAH